MSEIDLIALQAASEAFASDRLPDNWESLSNEHQNEWLDENRFPLFENYPPSEFFTLIDDHSDTVKQSIKEALMVLKAKLIDAAIECELPSDFNELDLQKMLGMK